MGRLLFAALMFATGCSSCGRNDNHPDAGVDGGAAVVTCATLTSSNTCDVTAGGSTTVIEGHVPAPSTIGSGGQAGLLRNLDKTLQEGLMQGTVKFDTFPLGDSSGTRRLGDCNYGTATTAAQLASVDAYEPHTSEGVDDFAHNEFLCE